MYRFFCLIFFDAQVLVFLNSSSKNLEDFCKAAPTLIQKIAGEIVKAGAKTLHLLFGDNYR